MQLPTGVTLVTDPEALLVNVTAATTAEQIEAELAEAEAEVGIVHEPTDEEQAAEAEAAAEGEGGGAAAEGGAPTGEGEQGRRLRLFRSRRDPSVDGRVESDAMSDDVWLVVGLGNPGPGYSGNRHNVGFMVVDLLAGRMGGRFKAHKARAEVVEGRLAGVRVVLAKPRTYMNDSGGPVSALRDFFKVPARPPGRRPRRARPAVRRTAAQARRRRQRPQRPEVGATLARAPVSSTGSGSASGDRPAGWTPPRSSCGTSARPSARTSTSRSTATADAVEALVTEGLERAQNTYNT